MTNPKYKDIGAVEDRLIEECSELIQAVCKAKRFGWGASHPDRKDTNNFIEIVTEFDDVKKTYDELIEKLFCKTCKGLGVIGGFDKGDNAFISEDCPDCGGVGFISDVKVDIKEDVDDKESKTETKA